MGHGKYIAPPEGQYKVQAGEKLTLEFTVLPGESRDVDLAVDLVGRFSATASNSLSPDFNPSRNKKDELG